MEAQVKSCIVTINCLLQIIRRWHCRTQHSHFWRHCSLFFCFLFFSRFAFIRDGLSASSSTWSKLKTWNWNWFGYTIGMSHLRIHQYVLQTSTGSGLSTAVYIWIRVKSKMIGQCLCKIRAVGTIKDAVRLGTPTWFLLPSRLYHTSSIYTTTASKGEFALVSRLAATKTSCTCGLGSKLPLTLSLFVHV